MIGRRSNPGRARIEALANVVARSPDVVTVAIPATQLTTGLLVGDAEGRRYRPRHVGLFRPRAKLRRGRKWRREGDWLVGISVAMRDTP